MDVIADTNIWLRIADDHSAQHGVARQAIRKLLNRKERVFLVPQNLIEFWSVATRPTEVNGLGWTKERTVLEIARMREQFKLITENERIFEKWSEIVHSGEITGKQVHDARLAAQLAVHNVSHLLTFNRQHFLRFPWLTILRPEDV